MQNPIQVRLRDLWPTLTTRKSKEEVKKDPAITKEEESNIVEEIRDSVKDVRDILDRLSKKEEEEVKENIGQESVSMTDNAPEKSKECPVMLVQKKEEKMENIAEVNFR